MDASRIGSLRVGEVDVGLAFEEGGVSDGTGVGAVWESRLVGMRVVGRAGGVAVVELEGMGFV